MPTRDGRPKHDQALRDKIAALWRLGHSGSEIAAQVGRLSRSAVLALVNRMGLPPRNPGTISNRSAARSALRSPRVKLVKPVTYVAVAARVALEPLAPAEHDPDRPCQWPYDAGDAVAVCGRPRDPDDWKSRYCAAHRAASARQGKGGGVTLRVRPAPNPAAARRAAPYQFVGGRS